MATLRLLCIPFAGGGATSFRGWAQRLPAAIEVFAVQLPGREDRIRDPVIVDWATLMQALVVAVAPLPPMPTAIFGHSLGAVIALELGRWMQERQPGRLQHVFASGRPWPGDQAGDEDDRERLHGLSDDDLLQALDRRYGSLATGLSHPDIRELLLPALRADLRLLDSYQYARSDALDCPLTVFAGRLDPATSTGNVAGWRQETRRAFNVRRLDGAHFFIDTHREALLADVVADLAQLAREPGLGDPPGPGSTSHLR